MRGKRVISFPFKLYLTRAPSQERNVTFSWYEAVIGAHDEVPLYITWTPTAAETRRENLTLEDGNRIRRDIPVVFKSVQPKVNECFEIYIILA